MTTAREVGRDFPLLLLLLCNSPSLRKLLFKTTGEWRDSDCGIFASQEQGASGLEVRQLWDSQPNPGVFPDTLLGLVDPFQYLPVPCQPLIFGRIW